nr:AraC family transcriptional regulator [Parvularcula maris]
MTTEAFAQHHILINLKPDPHRVENWRGGEHRDFIYNQHEVVVTPAGLASGWRWHATSQVIVVTIEPSPLARFAKRELGFVLSDRQLRNEPQRHDPDLCNAARQLHEALLADETTRGVLYEALARVFVVKLLDGYGDQRGEVHAPSAELGAQRYKRVLDFIAENHSGSVAVEDLADAAGMGPSTFARAFKATLGETPHQFLSRYRVERAQEMLAEPDTPMIDIALACGFSDQSHLGRVFKKVVGITPKAYRQRITE